jgi:hypothetical protein
MPCTKTKPAKNIFKKDCVYATVELRLTRLAFMFQAKYISTHQTYAHSGKLSSEKIGLLRAPEAEQINSPPLISS